MKKFNKFILLLLSLVFALSFAVFAIPNPDEAPEIYNVRWSRYTARWAVDGYESKFQVSLYRDDRKVITKTTTNKSYNFVSHMSRGDYTYYFEVRAYNEYYGWSSWEQSDYTYITHDDPVAPTVSPVGPGGGGGPREPSQPEPQVIYQPGGAVSVPGNWINNNGAWYFLYANGIYCTNTWLQYNGHWYYFNFSGQMVVGFVTINGKTYYLNPDGTMATGTIVFNGITHFFNQDGVMVY